MDYQKYIELSIIIPTIGRKVELDKLLFSLKNAVLKISYEIIVVDQNEPGFINEVISKHSKELNITHLNVNFKGLSKAKNFGTSLATGEYISFPDDDCIIFDTTYDLGLELLKKHDLDIVFGKCVDDSGKDSVLNFKKVAYYLNDKNMEGGFVEATAIIKNEIFKKNLLFDEKMGAGCFHGAEEGFDWLYRILIQKNTKVYYDPSVKFYHPQVIMSKGDIKSLKRVFHYRCGTAYLCKKHRFLLKFYKRLILSLFGFLFYLIFNRKVAKYYSVEFCALVVGWFLYDKEKR